MPHTPTLFRTRVVTRCRVFATFDRFDAVRLQLPEPTRTDADLTRYAAVELMKTRDYLAAAMQLE